MDIDLHFDDPEPAGVFEALPRLKRELAVNIKLAAPKDFIPVPEDWPARSPHVGSFGRLEVFHFDFTSQALAKLARGFERDRADFREMLERRLISAAELRAILAVLLPGLIRYPALDRGAFTKRINQGLAELEGGPP